jgi:hypothetical protein
VTACFKLVKLLRQQPRVDSEAVCSPCVYYSRNLDRTEYPVLMEKEDPCGLGFVLGDPDCSEMRTDNCSARKK